MTRRTNARLAGFAFLFYIAVGITSLVLGNRATAGEGTAAKLATIAQHATEMRAVALLTVLMCLSALVLGVTLYALTRDEDQDLAMLAMICRVVEGVNGAVGIQGTLSLLALATATAAGSQDIVAAKALGDYLLGDSAGISAIFFAVGSTIFSWLLLRGRLIPAPLAWLGLVASVLLVAGLPLGLAGVIPASVTAFLWAPMALFEIPLGFWLMLKGTAEPSRR